MTDMNEIETTAIIEKLPEEQRIQFSGVITSLLNAIPYAGGTIASIISEETNRRKLNRFCDSLKLLAQKIEDTETKVEDVLTKDQAVEIIDRGLHEIITTSNEEKIQLLRNALVNSYTDQEVSYDTKEVFLKLLIGLSGAEIRLLQNIYLRNDPFIKFNYPEEYRRQVLSGDITQLTMPASSSVAMPTYAARSEKYVSGDQTFEEYLKSTFPKEDDVAMFAAVSLLDSKGLTVIGNNLYDNTVKEIDMSPFSNLVVGTQQHGMFVDPTQERLGTPIEKSKTELGWEFINFIKKY